MKTRRPRLALLFRYGPAVHGELFHALPGVLEALAREAEVHYFGMRAAEAPPYTPSPGVCVHELPVTVDRRDPRDKLRKTLYWIARLPALARQCRRLDVAAIYVDETLPLAALLLQRFFGPRVAMTVADFFVEVYTERWWWARPLRGPIRRLDERAWRRLPLIFTRACAARDYLVSRGVPPNRIRPVYDPCDFSLYHPGDRRAARRRWGYTEEEVVLVHHGILHPNKANDWIIEAMAPLCRRFSQLRYLLVGDGPEMPRLRRMAREYGMEDRVQFAGWLPRPADVCEALNAGDIGLVMRRGMRSDDFHVTGALVHAMACGLPILAARLAGVLEIVGEGRNGWLFSPSDPAEFADRLAEAIEQPARRAQFGRQALADARERFAMERAVRETAGPLLDLVR